MIERYKGIYYLKLANGSTKIISEADSFSMIKDVADTINKFRKVDVKGNDIENSFNIFFLHRKVMQTINSCSKDFPEICDIVLLSFKSLTKWHASGKDCKRGFTDLHKLLDDMLQNREAGKT